MDSLRKCHVKTEISIYCDVIFEGKKVQIFSTCVGNSTTVWTLIHIIFDDFLLLNSARIFLRPLCKTKKKMSISLAGPVLAYVPQVPGPM